MKKKINYEILETITGQKRRHHRKEWKDQKSTLKLEKIHITSFKKEGSKILQ